MRYTQVCHIHRQVFTSSVKLMNYLMFGIDTVAAVNVFYVPCAADGRKST